MQLFSWDTLVQYQTKIRDHGCTPTFKLFLQDLITKYPGSNSYYNASLVFVVVSFSLNFADIVRKEQHEYIFSIMYPPEGERKVNQVLKKSNLTKQKRRMIFRLLITGYVTKESFFALAYGVRNKLSENENGV